MSDPTDIAQWLRLDARLTTSGQPREDQLAALRDIGVAHVINLALLDHERSLADEAGDVAALGMRYTHIPVVFDAPRQADFDRFCAAMGDTADAAVHVHCIVNARVSAFLYRYRREVQGMAEPEVRAALEAIWRPGGVWAAFIGDAQAVDRPHAFAGRDYPRPAEPQRPTEE